MTREVSPNGYTDAYGPNVANILSHGSREIRGKIPSSVRKDLRDAVRDGVLVHLKKDGLKPEMFCHPLHVASAKEAQYRSAMYSVECIKGVVA